MYWTRDAGSCRTDLLLSEALSLSSSPFVSVPLSRGFRAQPPTYQPQITAPIENPDKLLTSTRRSMLLTSTFLSWPALLVVRGGGDGYRSMMSMSACSP